MDNGGSHCTKKDPKKLCEVKLPGSNARKTMKGFDDLAKVCTSDH